MSGGMRIHIARAGQTSGPYALEDVRGRLLSGEIQPHDWAWYPGVKRWVPVSEVPGLEEIVPPVISAAEPAVEPPQREVSYHHVSAVKFIVYSILSFGIYDVFWFYRNWRFIKARDRSGIMPFWRAIFAPLWCYSLMKDVATTAGAGSMTIPALAAIGYFAVSALAALPDPYWLISLGAFVLLLHPVRLINRINREQGMRGPYYSRVRIHHVLLCGFGALFCAFVVLSSLSLLPSTQVLPGERLPRRDVAWLRAAGIVKPDEIVEYFYSGGILSIREQGYVVTDKRVSAYEGNSDRDEMRIQSASYDEIEDVRVEYGAHSLENTEVFIKTGEEQGFSLFFSTEQKVDRRCVQTLMRLWKRAHATSKRRDPESI